MGGATGEQQLLQDYLDRYMGTDSDWLELHGNSATYWQARLPQSTTVSLLPDGRAKWRVRTTIVEQISDPVGAQELCLALNWYAIGWSFAYDAERRTFDALTAICARPEWDTFLLRLAEKSKLSAWMADVIAERLGVAVGGVPAFSHPQRQAALRDVFDPNYSYAEAVRRRPEWLMDPTWYPYTPIEDAASYIGKMIGVSESDIEVGDTEFRFPVDTRNPQDPVWLMAGLSPNRLMGESFHSALALGGAPSAKAPAEVSAMTWGLFNDPQAALLGGWSYHDDDLKFFQWNTMSEVRQQERLDSWDGRGVGDLWGFTSTLIDPLNALTRVGLTRCQESELAAGLQAKAAHVMAAITEQARPAVEIGLNRPAGEFRSDARLLWLERSRIIAIAVWFNPREPMVTSLEVCTLTDKTEFLICFKRHPLKPRYCIFGKISDEAVRAFIPSDLPNALALFSNPEATPEEVPPSLRRRVLDVAAASGQDLVAEAGWIAETMGHPWELETRGSVVAAAVRNAAMELAANDPESEDPFAKWWREVSRYGNVMLNFNCLPNAWDGAINSQRAYGGLDAFDIGPLVITYAKAGLEGTR